MRAWVLGSGSDGNSTLLESGSDRLLVDAGFSLTELERRLGRVRVNPDSIRGVVLTHAHGDHARGAAAGSRKYGWPVFAARGTVSRRPELRNVELRTFRAGDRFAVGRFSVRTVPTPHKCAEPVALVVRDRWSGRRAGVCTDLGHVTPSLRRALRQLDLLILESNHDLKLLEASSRPPAVKSWIRGKTGHLSNEQAVELVESVISPRLRHVVLAHVSRECNCRRRVRRLFTPRLDAQGFRGALHIAHQNQVKGPFGLIS